MATDTMAKAHAQKRTVMAHRSDERLAELIAQRVLRRYEGETILDVGCGDGAVSRFIPEHISYSGLDISQACIYEQEQDNASIRYVEANRIPTLMANEGPWDTILLLDVIEHTRDFTGLVELAMARSNKNVVVSLPNELFILDRLRMLFGKEHPAHSLSLLGQPEGFKHQFIINIDKAREILVNSARSAGFQLEEEIVRPLIAKENLMKPTVWLFNQISSDQVRSMGIVFVFTKNVA